MISLVINVRLDYADLLKYPLWRILLLYMFNLHDNTSTYPSTDETNGHFFDGKYFNVYIILNKKVEKISGSNSVTIRTPLWLSLLALRSHHRYETITHTHCIPYSTDWLKQWNRIAFFVIKQLIHSNHTKVTDLSFWSFL